MNYAIYHTSGDLKRTRCVGLIAGDPGYCPAALTLTNYLKHLGFTVEDCTTREIEGMDITLAYVAEADGYFSVRLRPSPANPLPRNSVRVYESVTADGVTVLDVVEDGTINEIKNGR